MAQIYKQLTSNDIVTTHTLLHESVPITGTLVSGSYSGTNIESPSHGRYQRVWDYNYASASANHLFDITLCLSSGSTYHNLIGTDSLATAKMNMYDTLAQVLMGHDATGSILDFDEDGNLLAGGTKITGSYALCFSRLLVKDEIKKGSFNMYLALSGTYATPRGGDYGNVLITDSGAETSYFVNSPAGEYGVLNSGSTAVGLLFYQAGVAVLNAEKIFMTSSVNGSVGVQMDSSTRGVNYYLSTGTIDAAASALRYRINNITFNNTTDLNSTVVFCRMDHGSFNYSSNPTYLSGSKIRTKNVAADAPVAYYTGIGLYSPDNELLAVSKISTPLKKTSDTEQIIRLRIDF